jgi:hypothetical protein
MEKSSLSDSLKILSIMCLTLGIFFLMGPVRVWADDIDVTTSFDGVGIGVAEQSDHTDADPWKGWLNLTVTNDGDEAWGDFHFEIFQVSSPVDNVDFIVSSPYEPTSSQSGLTWVVDNATVGATLDLYFYSDPVMPGDTASFKVYTDNTTNKIRFGVLFYPTPVPIPSAVWLLGSALFGLIGIRKRFGR